MNSVGKRLKGTLVGRRFNDTKPETLSLLAQAAGVGEGVVVNVNSIHGLATSQLPGKFAEDPGFRYGDGSYYLPTVQEVQYVLQQSNLDRMTWLAERFDCDDFAYVLKGEMSAHAYQASNLKFGFCVGIAWGQFDWVDGFHAVNWFIDAQTVLHFIEPQRDDIYGAEHCKGEISLFLV